MGLLEINMAVLLHSEYFIGLAIHTVRTPHPWENHFEIMVQLMVNLFFIFLTVYMIDPRHFHKLWLSYLIHTL